MFTTFSSLADNFRIGSASDQNFIKMTTLLFQYCRNPAGTRRNNNIFTTSTRRRRRRVDVVKTLSLRHCCVMCQLGKVNGGYDADFIGLEGSYSLSGENLTRSLFTFLFISKNNSTGKQQCLKLKCSLSRPEISGKFPSLHNSL